MKTHSLSRLVAGALTLASAMCVVTAIRIEHLDRLAGGAIQRKAEQEPNSKWRMGGSQVDAYRHVQAEWRKEKGLSPDAELSASDWEVIQARMNATKRTPSPHDELGEALKSWGLVQYPLAAALLIASLIASANRKLTSGVSKWVFYFHASIGALALGLAVYRGYFSSLGW